jgi:hypothetical protein
MPRAKSAGQLVQAMRDAGWSPIAIERRTGIPRTTQRRAIASPTNHNIGSNYLPALREARRAHTVAPKRGQSVAPVPSHPRSGRRTAHQRLRAAIQRLASIGLAPGDDAIDFAVEHTSESVIAEWAERGFMFGTRINEGDGSAFSAAQRRWADRERQINRAQRGIPIQSKNFDAFFYYHPRKV